MILRYANSSNVDIVRFLAQGIKDPDAKIKIMHNFAQLNNNKNFTRKLSEQYETKVHELKQKNIVSNKEEMINNRVTHNNLDSYTKFRLNGLRKVLKYD